MRLALAAAAVFAVGLGACGDKGAPSPIRATPAGSAAAPPAASPAPATAPGFDACAVGSRALEQVSACAAKADPKGWKVTQQGFGTVAGAIAQNGAQTAQLTCAQMLRAIEADLQKAGCPLELDESERTQLDGIMTRWYAIRTPVVPTGHAASDEVIGRIVRTRDRLCACTDMACLKEVDATLDLIGSLPDGAPKAAKDLGDALIDDMGRCEARLRNTGH